MLIIFSKGDLVPYRPEVDFEGTDLHVAVRHKPGEIRLQVKARTRMHATGKLAVRVEAYALPEGDPKFLVVVDYDTKKAAPRSFVWVIPATAFRHLANFSRNGWGALLNTSPFSADKWVDFRYNFNDLPWVVTSLIEHQTRGEELPQDAEGLRACVGRGAPKRNAKAARRKH